MLFEPIGPNGKILDLEPDLEYFRLLRFAIDME
jgi:hypothetical protein